MIDGLVLIALGLLGLITIISMISTNIAWTDASDVKSNIALLKERMRCIEIDNANYRDENRELKKKLANVIRSVNGDIGDDE